MIRTSVSMEHDKDNGRYIFKIIVPDDNIPDTAMRSMVLSSGSPRLMILDYARERIEKEALWSKCPDWDLD